jgi:DNA polymerase-3 subunit gamma/tau
MPYEPLHHKYRPQTFADLVGQEAIATTLTNAIITQRIAPAYLLTGPRGTGKTSSARILAKSLNCLSSNQPTPTPCGKCEVCRAIARGSALDVIEIDAASNTGVDNIREIIERAQFAPVQCRYKVYAIDECLTGDSLVQTSQGLVRIDNPNLKGQLVLSYNEISQVWEYKKVLRWLERGVKQTLIIKTTNREIRCTGNHLIRTDAGWIRAQNVKEGMKILSPVNVDAAALFLNMVQTDVSANLLEDINLEAINTDKKNTTLPLLWNKLKLFAPCVLVDVAKNSIFQLSYSTKEKELSAFIPTGQNIPTRKDTVSGSVEQKISSSMPRFYNQKSWDLSTEPYWEMVASTTQTSTVDFLDYAGRTETYKDNGWNTKLAVLQNCNLNYDLLPTEVMEKTPSVAKQSVIPNLKRFWRLSNQTEKNMFPWIGCNKSLPKDELGGTWMMAHSVTLQQEAHLSSFIQKDIPTKKINSLPIGLQIWDIPQQQNLSLESLQAKPTITSKWEQTLVKNGYQIYDNIQFHQWITSLEIVKSVELSEVEKVYDLEVEDNHNFVANKLLVHNCHMLSTAAFNALLKTLEEPPERVIFILATTDPQRVLPTIISRCQRFDYRRIPLESMVTHLKTIASKENIDIDHEAITLVAQIANGGLRDAQSLLDQLSLLSGQVTPDRVWDLVGSVAERDLLALLRAIASDQAEVVIEQSRQLMNRGREPLIILQNLAGFYLNLLLAKTAPNRPDLVPVTSSTWQELSQEAQNWDLNTILQGQQHLKESEAQLKNTTQPRLWLEVSLLGLLPSAYRSQPSIAVSPTSPEVTLSRRATQSQPSSPSSEAPQSQLPTAEPVQESSAPKSREPATNKVIATPVTPPNSSDAQISDQKRDRTMSQTQIWQAVIEHLQSFTQALVRPHCHLLSLEGNVAHIGIKTEPLLRHVKGKVVEIEAAFKAVCLHPVKVHLQVTNQIAPNFSSKPLSEETDEEKRVFSPEISNNSANNCKQQPIEPPPEKIDSEISEKSSFSVSEREQVITNKPSDLTPFPTVQNNPTSQFVEKRNGLDDNRSDRPFADYSEDELRKAAESLAKCFEGEIVILTHPIDDVLSIDKENEKEVEILVSEPFRSTTVAENNLTLDISNTKPDQTTQPIIRERLDLTNFENEDDIPF